jgi:hypothetical protein
MEPYEEEEVEEEEEQEDPARFDSCYLCKKALPATEKRRKRFRKCRGCINSGTRKSRVQDPVRLLHFKWRVSTARHAFPVELRSMDVVRDVYERCGKRSVLSGVTDHKRLCIVSKVKQPTTADDLVVVTTREAIVLSKKRNEEERMRMFELFFFNFCECLGCTV